MGRGGWGGSGRGGAMVVVEDVGRVGWRKKVDHSSFGSVSGPAQSSCLPQSGQRARW